jgi:tetratricopeptide (TPR) repeat protein
LANAYLENGEFTRALEAASAAAKLKPGDPNVMRLLAVIYDNFEMVEESLVIYREMAKMLPGEAGLKEKIDQLSSVLKDPAVRREWLFAGIPAAEPKKNPQHSDTCIRAMEMWDDYDEEGKITTDNLKAAAALFEKVMEKDKKHMHAYSDAAIIYEALGQYYKASAVWERGLTVSPRNQRAVDSISRLGFLYELSLNSRLPNDRKIDIYNNIGVLYWKNGEFDFAIEYFEKALRLNPRHAHSLANLGLNYIETGKYPEARAALESVLKSDPNFPFTGPMKDSLQWLRGMLDVKKPGV